MMLSPNPAQWPPAALFELEERIAMTAEGKGEDPASPSRETVRQAREDIRRRWEAL